MAFKKTLLTLLLSSAYLVAHAEDKNLTISEKFKASAVARETGGNIAKTVSEASVYANGKSPQEIALKIATEREKRAAIFEEGAREYSAAINDYLESADFYDLSAGVEKSNTATSLRTNAKKCANNYSNLVMAAIAEYTLASSEYVKAGNPTKALQMQKRAADYLSIAAKQSKQKQTPQK